jgi:hypothetical protein
MDKYILLVGIALVTTVISFIIETVSPIIKEYKKNKDIKNAIYRFLHYFVVLYVLLFSFLFKSTSIHAYIYLFVVLGYLMIWYICDCCVLSYLELKTYDVDHNKYDKTFHPVFAVFTGDGNIPVSAMIVVFLIIQYTLGSILYYNTLIPIYIKIAFIVLAIFFFIQTMVKDRLNNTLKYPTNKGSFFMKYLCF